MWCSFHKSNKHGDETCHTQQHQKDNNGRSKCASQGEITPPSSLQATLLPGEILGGKAYRSLEYLKVPTRDGPAKEQGFWPFGHTAFQGGQRHHGRFGTPEEEKAGVGAGGRGEATVGESFLATPLWGMLYADDAGIVSQPPVQLRKMMGVIVVVCVAFGVTVSEAKTEIMCLRAKRMPESIATSSVEVAGQVYNQTNEFIYLGERKPQFRPVHRGRPAHTQRMVQLPEVHRRTVRPTERSPRAQNPDAKSLGTRDNAIRLSHVEPGRLPL